MEGRFWSKVDKSGTCWLWTGAMRRNGYGCFKYKDHLRGAHRVAYMLVHGDISDDVVVMHACDNRRCVNPAHLSLGTKRDNTQDAIRKARHHMPPLSGKLTLVQVKEIRHLHDGGLGYSRLAKAYGLNRSTIGEIVRGEIWREAA